MNLYAKKIKYDFNKNDTIVLFITEEGLKDRSGLMKNKLSYIFEKIDFKFFKAKKSETMFIPFSENPNIIICGLGSAEKADSESVRNSAAAITALCRSRNMDTINILIPEIKNFTESRLLRLIAEGIYLSNYSFSKYKSKNSEDEKHPIKKALFYTDEKLSSAILNEVKIISGNTILCRDLVNETSDKITPLRIAKEAKKLSSINGISCRVYGKKEIEKMRMGLLLAVNKGSKIPPQLVVLEYTGNPKEKKSIAIVGKGITFDSGGINLKPSGHIETMRMDMSGAAAVLYALKSAAELKLKKNIVAVMPLTENMLSNEAYRPGDIFKAYNGKSVEIGNTDAEGRLILADALAFTEKKLNPDYIIDLATLTGACLVTFGETVAGMLSNNDHLAKIIEESAEATGEKVWRLPLYSDYDEPLKSEIADLCNISADRNAGTIIGAVFLKNFINDKKWAHIDIAGTAWYSKQRGYRPKNATGFGVRLLIETLKVL